MTAAVMTPNTISSLAEIVCLLPSTPRARLAVHGRGFPEAHCPSWRGGRLRVPDSSAHAALKPTVFRLRAEATAVSDVRQSTAALGAALARTGQTVVVIDFDMGLRNLDLVMGAERRVVYDFVDVIQGAAKLPQALIRNKRIETLFLLPASQTRDKDALTEDGVARVIEELRPKFDWVICDSPAGIERGATLAMRHADAAVVVTNPEVSSVHDSHRIIGLLDAKTEKAERGERIEKHLLLTRYDPARAERGEMLKVDDVLEILS